MQGLLGPDPKLANDIVHALWMARAGYTKGKGKEAAGNAFAECLCWLLTQVTASPGVLDTHTPALPARLHGAALHCLVLYTAFTLLSHCCTAIITAAVAGMLCLLSDGTCRVSLGNQAIGMPSQPRCS